MPKDEIDKRVRNAARVLGLEEFLDRKPRALSGGQRQRVAMGRAIVREPQAYLMDEPLSNLDAKLRVHMRAEIASLQDQLGVTTIYVTHDQVEAMTMGDRVAVMRKGELQQVAPPQELYERPVNLFVGGFIGSPAMNMVEATIEQSNSSYVAKVGSQSLTLGDEVVKERPALEKLRRPHGRARHPSGKPRGREPGARHPGGPAHQGRRRPPRASRLGDRRALRGGRSAGADRGRPRAGARRRAGKQGAGARRRTRRRRSWSAGSGLVHASRTVTTIDVAVDTSGVHLFDVETGAGIYG